MLSAIRQRTLFLPAAMLLAACASKSNAVESPAAGTTTTTTTVRETPAAPVPVATSTTSTTTTTTTTATTSSGAAITADPAQAKKGQGLFISRGCNGCHTIGKGKSAGPDLNGITSRRSASWLRTWLHDPPAMVASGEPTAVALFHEYNNLQMPNMKLTDAEIESLLSYIASKSK